MLLIVVSIDYPSFHLFSWWKKFFISLVPSIKSMVSICGRLSPHSLEMFSVNPLQAYSFRCWFSNNSVITFLEGCFPSSFVAEVGIFFSILLFQWSIFYSFFRRLCDVALFTHHVELWGHVLFFHIHLTAVLCSHSISFHLNKSCISFQPECCPNLIVLVPCLSRFNQSGFNSFLSIKLLIHVFATFKFS